VGPLLEPQAKRTSDRMNRIAGDRRTAQSCGRRMGGRKPCVRSRL
jgi:hypothetical protein